MLVFLAFELLETVAGLLCNKDHLADFPRQTAFFHWQRGEKQGAVRCSGFLQGLHGVAQGGKVLLFVEFAGFSESDQQHPFALDAGDVMQQQ